MIEKVLLCGTNQIINVEDFREYYTKRKRLTAIVNNQYILEKSDEIIFKCDKCGKLRNNKFSKKFLDNEILCMSCLQKKIFKKKYGNENYRNTKKAKQTCLERYGFKSHNQLKEVKEKKKQTWLKKYGVDNPNKSKIILEKRAQTNIKKYNNRCSLHGNNQKYTDNNIKLKYGVCNPHQNEYVKKKIKNTVYRKTYKEIVKRTSNKVEPLFTNNEYIGGKDYKLYRWKCKKCNTEFQHHIRNGCIPRCPICFPYTRSYYEQELFYWIHSLQLNVIQNIKRLIEPYELDLYLPDYNLAIEFNGLYWHSTEFITDKWYHQNKVKLCHNKGIRLLHIWEDDWKEDKNKIKEKILHYIHNINEEIKPKKPVLENRNGYSIWM